LRILPIAAYVALASVLTCCAGKSSQSLDGLWSGKKGQGSITFKDQNFSLERDFPPGGRVVVAGTYTLNNGQLTLNPTSAEAAPGESPIDDARKTSVMNSIKALNPMTQKWDSEDLMEVTDKSGTRYIYDRIPTSG